MDRRAFLATAGPSLAAAIAGCLADSNNNTGTHQETDTPFPELAVTGDTIPEDHESGLTASVELRRQFSGDAPAQLRIEVVNQRSTHTLAETGPTPPFSQYAGDHAETEATVYIIPEESNDVFVQHVDRGDGSETEPDSNGLPSSPVNECWQIGDIAWNAIASQKSLGPEAALSRTYTIFADGKNNGCLPPGDYRFETSWSIWPDSGVDDDESSTESPPERVSVDWGFTLSIGETNG